MIKLARPSNPLAFRDCPIRQKPTAQEVAALAAEVKRLARVRNVDRHLMTNVAVRILGKDGVCVDDELAGAAYLRRRVDGGFQILLRPDIDIRSAIAHELGHFAIRQLRGWHLTSLDEETTANEFAEALIGRRYQDQVAA